MLPTANDMVTEREEENQLFGQEEKVMDPVESLDDLALRISERCRDVINEELVKYFGKLIVASGQRRVRVLQPAVQPGKGTPSHKSKPPPPERQLLDMLRDGPKTTAEIMDELDLSSRQMVTYTVGKAKKLIVGNRKVIRCKRGRGEKPTTYALRDVDEEV